MNKYVFVMQIRSSINLSNKHKLVLVGLGLRYIGHIIFKLYTREICGMLNKIFFIVKVGECNNAFK